MSPAKSKAQQRFFGAELARKREGKKTKTNMSGKQMEDYASTKQKGLPDHAEENMRERQKMMGGQHMMPGNKPPLNKKPTNKKPSNRKPSNRK